MPKIFHRSRISHLAMTSIEIPKRVFALFHEPYFVLTTITVHGSLFLAAYLMMHLEHGINPKLQTWVDAFYWAVATIATVGYGDIVPVTDGGKFVAMALMIIGTLATVGYTFFLVNAVVSPEISQVQKKIRTFDQDVREVESHVEAEEQQLANLVLEVKRLTFELERRLSKPTDRS